MNVNQVRGQVGLNKFTPIHPLGNIPTKFQDILLKTKNINLMVA